VVTPSAEFPNDNPALHRGAVWVCTRVVGAATAELPAPTKGPEVRCVAPPAAAEPDAVTFEVERDEDEERGPLAEPPPPRQSGMFPIGAFVGGDEPDHELGDLLTAAGCDHDDHDDHDEPFVVEELEPLGEIALEGGGAPEPVLAAGPEPAPAPEPAAASRPGIARTALPPPPDDPFVVLVHTLADVALAEGSPHVASLLPALLFEGRLDRDLHPGAMRALEDAGAVAGGQPTGAFAATTRAWSAILRGASDDFTACGTAMLDEWAADVLARLLGVQGRSAALRRELRARGVAAFGLVEAA
jgi:hypothetical protein